MIFYLSSFCFLFQKQLTDDMLDITRTQIEPWFIPFDIIMIITITLTIILGLAFLILVAIHPTCWSVPMLLICNSCIAQTILSIVLLAMAVFSFQHDFKQDVGDVSFCSAIGFLCYTITVGLNYSFLIIALYRYITVVYPTLYTWQSMRCQICLIISKWIFSIAFGLSMYLTNQIVYNINNQICQIPLSLSVPLLAASVILYMAPNFGMVLIYIQLTRYIHRISARTTVANNLFHARRELKLIQRTFILSSTLIFLGVPYMIFVFISFVTEPPKYHFRIAYFSIDFSMLAIVIMMFYFTQQVRDIIRKPLLRSTTVMPIGSLDVRQIGM